MTTNVTKFAPKNMQELIDAVGKLVAQVEALQRQANKPPQPQALPGFDMTWPATRQEVRAPERKYKRKFYDPQGRQMWEVLMEYIPIGEANAVSSSILRIRSGVGFTAANALSDAAIAGKPKLHRRLTNTSLQPSPSNPWLYWRDP